MARTIGPRWGVMAAAAAIAMMASGPGRRAVLAQNSTARPTAAVEWKTYGADLASTRYSPLDQINAANFSSLRVAWKVSTEPFLYSATPLFAGDTLYTTIGVARTVVAIHPATGELLWKHTE